MLKNTRVKGMGIAATAVAVVGGIVFSPAAALADEGENANDPVMQKVQSMPKGATTISFTEGETVAEGSGIVPFQTSWGMGEGSEFIGNSGSNSVSALGFGSTLTWANSGTFIKMTNGHTYTGLFANKVGNVKLKDHFWATGLGVSVSAPVGAGFSLFVNEATYESSKNNTNSLDAYYTGLEFSGPIFTVSQNSTADWFVGGAEYHLTVN